jgi:hypothetical protein
MKKILRGWWFRDYKNDYPNAIKLLEEADKANLAQPAKDDTLDLRKFGRSILLETYYLDAQSPAGKTSYEKASTLLTGWVKEDSFYYPALELFNHKLGKDEETKQLLEDAIRDNRQDYRAYLALARLYTFHLFDLQGGLKTLEQIPPDKTNGEYFRIKAYLQLFMGNYAEAQKVFGLSDSYGIPNVLAAFYNAWALFAQQKDSEGYAAAQQWKAEMEKFRRTSKHKELKTTLERSEATLDAAGRALEIETRLSAKQKKLLRAMYAAMTDQSQPLPSIP